MNWFDASGLTSLAKTALKEAQKTIDKALDIEDDSSEDQEGAGGTSTAKSSPTRSGVAQKDNTDFFSSWGLSVSAEVGSTDPIQEQPVVTESPSKSNSQSLWGSFAGSFFEHPKSGNNTIVHPPKAKSMNIISDKYDSQDDLFSTSQLVMSDGGESVNVKKEDVAKSDNRRNSSMSNVLSFMSSRNSSDSVEVLSQSLKSTPESELSCHTISHSHSSSVGIKHNSESVEILPDSLVSPSSIECLGFDSYASDKNSSNSLNLSPVEASDKKSTPVGDGTERAETADSVSLVADDEEDTMSYNSISECTAPTVLDTDDKPVSPFPKMPRIELRKTNDKDIVHLEHPMVSHKMQISENSSNDGSWSDRTLNADNDSVTLEQSLEELKKATEQEDMLMDKLSDSSSFYNVNVSGELIQSGSSAFVNVGKQQRSSPGSTDSSQKEASVKERNSPVSSDSKSDLVKIGSDRTSGHTSGDDLETATSSDIEIIPSPNGESSNGCRNSPAKHGFKTKVDGATSPNLVDLVLGKNLATKIRGHNRELSEASIQSNTSDESQCSENDRLMRRLCEMAEILDARENRLMEVSRNNAELVECNANLKSQMESLLAKHDGGDINTITEDYTQRMSALEKKFQQAIREKDQLRKQLDSLKSDVSRKSSSDFENMLKEKDEMISQLQEEGEKLARHELQHTNIIKKLRAKEKDNEQVIKGLRDKISEQTGELERLKRCLGVKEELEVNQTEAMQRLSAAHRTMEIDFVETKNALEDATRRLATARAALEEARRDQGEGLRGELRLLRAERLAEERRHAEREEALRRELAAAGEALAAAAAREAERRLAAGDDAALRQLAALQRDALQRERDRGQRERQHRRRLAEAETAAAKALERERLAREEAAAAEERLAAAREELAAGEGRAGELREAGERAREALEALRAESESKTRELKDVREESEKQIAALTVRVSEMESELTTTRAALDTERQRAAILQSYHQLGNIISTDLRRAGDRNSAGLSNEQLPPRGDSPASSSSYDASSSSFWTNEALPAGASALVVSDALAAASRAAGSRRTRADALAALAGERAALAAELAGLRAALDDQRARSGHYDALLLMYGEKEEQLEELRLDLHDVTLLYKAQLDELLALRRRVERSS